MSSRLNLLQRAFFVAICLIFVAPQQGQANDPSQVTQETAPSITVQSLQTLAGRKSSFLLLDVRQPEEYAESHIEGATLIPLGQLPDQYQGLPKDKTLVVYCRSGKRSDKATAFLLDHGYKNAVTLSGGMNAWIESKNRVVSK